MCLYHTLMIFWNNITFIWSAPNQIISHIMTSSFCLLWSHFYSSPYSLKHTVLCVSPLYLVQLPQHPIILTFQKPMIFHSIFPKHSHGHISELVISYWFKSIMGIHYFFRKWNRIYNYRCDGYLDTNISTCMSMNSEM